MTSESLTLDTTMLVNLQAQGTALTLAYAKIEELEAEIAAMQKQLDVCQERREAELKRLDETALTATIQAVTIGELSPWAEVGKRAVREQWWMLCGVEPDALHDLALLAQLEAEQQP